jgi:hypothetical protein
MSWGVLLVLPPRSVTLPAEATLVALASFRDEPIVRLVRVKTTREVHLVNLFALEDTEKCLCSYTVLESRYNPVDCEGLASTSSAKFLKFEGIGLGWSCRLLPRSIVTPFLRRWSIMWKAWLGGHSRTRRWRTGGMKRRVEWCIMRSIQLRRPFGGDWATFL